MYAMLSLDAKPKRYIWRAGHKLTRTADERQNVFGLHMRPLIGFPTRPPFDKQQLRRVMPDCGYHGRDMLDEGMSERYADPPRGGLLTGLEELVNEPPAPDYRH